MSGYPEVGEHPMTVVRDTDPDTVALAVSSRKVGAFDPGPAGERKT